MGLAGQGVLGVGGERGFLALLIFLGTYLGIAIGGIPGLQIDRTGIAVLGATAMVTAGCLTPEEALGSIHVPTLLLLYGLMVLSAQFRIGGFYTRVALFVTGRFREPKKLLFWLIIASGTLSALLANDIVCLAFTPVVVVSTLRLGLNPVPFLLGLAMASNIGSAATVIGNPQNMLIGQWGGLPFGRFTLWCGPPSALGLLLLYLWILLLYRGRWYKVTAQGPEACAPWPSYNHHHTTKGLVLTFVLLGLFFTRVPREVTAITVAGILLCSRYVTTRDLLSQVDWPLLALFIGLFVVIGGVSKFGIPQGAVLWLKTKGMDLHSPLVLSALTLILSNLFSNVPAVTLLLHSLSLPEGGLFLLALISTFAGNLITIGSIANLITLEGAQRMGVRVSFCEYARTGIPVTLTTAGLGLLWWAILGDLIG